MKTPLIEYTDGDDALTIANGGGVTANANLAVKNGNTSAGGVSFYENSDNGSHYMKLQAAAAMGGDVTLTLPSIDGSNGQVLSTNGSGTLSWAANSGSGASNVTGLTDGLVENNSIFIGNDPSSTTDAASYNTGLGVTALTAITTGDDNTALGYDALGTLTSGAANTALGSNTLRLTTSGNYNTDVGYAALKANKTGTRNIAIGL